MRYWLYLWVDDPGVVSATVTAGAVSVTATAKMTSVIWTMGEPVSADNLGEPGCANHLSGHGNESWTSCRYDGPACGRDLRVHVSGAVDPGAYGWVGYLAGDGDGELDDHLGGEYR